MGKQRLGAIILGGGRGERLSPLTSYRAKPAVQIGGKYRLIDVPISNCINSGIRHIHILTQFNTLSLHRHIYQTYKFDTFSKGTIEILAAQQTLDNNEWFQGTADAVRSYWNRFKDMKVTHYVVLAGDHLYKMDYDEFFQNHLDTNSDISIGVIPKGREEAKELGVLKTDDNDVITKFVEKPQTEEEIDAVIDARSEGDNVLASMGIYIFSKEVLKDLLSQKGNDFGKNLIPPAITKYKTSAYRFQGYWEDIGTIKTFFESSIALTEEKPHFSFYDANKPIYTRSRYLPGSRIHGAVIEDSIVNEGCIIGDAKITNSIIGMRGVIQDNVSLDRVYMMGADFYEEEARERVEIPVGIGEGSILKNIIVDKNARIGKNVRLVNQAGIQSAEAKNYTIKQGIIIIPKGAVIPDGFEL